jgi:putative heme iron utilization protein
MGAEHMNEERRPETAFDGRGLGRHLLRVVRSGALGTIAPQGAPFTSLVTVATAFDGSPLILTSGLSAHTAHMEQDPRVSLLLAETRRGDPLAHPRLTVSGRAERVPGTEARERFLARHPKAVLYMDFPDFGFWRIHVTGGHLNGGFARAATLSRQDLILDISDAEALKSAEARAIGHMNDDHTDALVLYATRIAREADGPWLASGCDPEGIDLICGERSARITFPRRVTSPSALRAVLVELAEAARQIE